MSLLITLGDAPFIRYYDPYGTGTNPSAKLARLMQAEIDELQKVDDTYPSKNEFKKTILIIVDRTFDMMAPFLHEFTYQAMFNDLIVKPPYENDNSNIK
jgi:syntaxin-binding protein 1